MKLKNKCQELRAFGYLMGIMLILIFAIILPAIFDRIFGYSIILLKIYTTPIWPWLVACCLWIAALTWSILLQPLYFTWMKVGVVFGWINTRLIMLLLFYGIMLPIGLILRLLGQDTMNIKTRKSSYRIISKSTDKNHLERPY